MSFLVLPLGKADTAKNARISPATFCVDCRRRMRDVFLEEDVSGGSSCAIFRGEPLRLRLFMCLTRLQVSELDSDPSNDFGGLGSCPLRRVARGIARSRRRGRAGEADGEGATAGGQQRQLSRLRLTLSWEIAVVDPKNRKNHWSLVSYSSVNNILNKYNANM